MRRIVFSGLIAFFLAGCSGKPGDFELVTEGYARESRVYALLADGFQSYKKRKAIRAKRQLEQAVLLGVKHPIVLYRLAVVTRISGKSNKAAALFREAAKGFKKNNIRHRYAAWSWLGAGNLAYRAKKYKKAEGFYLQAFTIAPADPGVLNRLGKVYFTTKRYKMVVSYLNRVKPGVLKNDLLLSDAYLKLERFIPVATLLEPHHSGGDTPLPVLMNLGLARMGMAKRAEAKKQFRKAYRNALKGRDCFEQTVLRLDGGDEPFVRKLSKGRRRYFRIRSKEYRDFSRREVTRLAKKMGGGS